MGMSCWQSGCVRLKILFLTDSTPFVNVRALRSTRANADCVLVAKEFAFFDIPFTTELNLSIAVKIVGTFNVAIYFLFNSLFTSKMSLYQYSKP